MEYQKLFFSDSRQSASARRKRVPERYLSYCLIAFLLARTASAETVVFQNGLIDTFSGASYSGTEDTKIRGDYVFPPFGSPVFNGANNFGATDQLSVGYEAGIDATERMLIRFDLRSMAGKFLSIESVTLRLHATESTLSRSVSAYRVSAANSDWVEGNGQVSNSFESNDIGGSSWQFKIQGSTPDIGVAWASGEPLGPQRGLGSAGVDYFPAAIGTVTTPPYPDPYPDLVFNDVSFVSDWISGANGGLLLRLNDETTSADFGFYSSESVTANFRPELIITYTPAPEPSVVLLLCSVISVAFGGRSRRRRM